MINDKWQMINEGVIDRMNKRATRWIAAQPRNYGPNYIRPVYCNQQKMCYTKLLFLFFEYDNKPSEPFRR